MTIWLGYALGDMVLIGLAAVMAKSAVKKNNSNLAAALWGILLLIFSIVMVNMTATGQKLTGIGARSWLFLILSGLSMGGAWLCLFRSLRTGEAIKIVPVYLSNHILAMLIRVIMFHKRYSSNQWIAMVLLAIGTVLIALHSGKSKRGGYTWLWFALLSSLLACASTILTEYGVSGVNEYVSLSIRTAAALVVAITATAAVGGKTFRSMTFPDGMMICFSGAAVGGSWICYHRALALGPDAVVTHMDRLSVLAVLIFGCIFLRERLSLRAVIGYVFVVCGVFLMLLQTPLLELLV